jgi:HlyD family secretion protein
MSKKKKKSKLKSIIFIVILLVAVGITYSLLTQKEETLKVTVSEVEQVDITELVKAIGRIQPEKEVKISSEISGELIFLGVKEGFEVKKGDVLARVRPDIIESQLEQLQAATRSASTEIEVAKAELERAKLDLDRVQELFEKEFTPKQQLDQATAAFRQAKARVEASEQRFYQTQASLNEVRRNKERTTIFSPIDGIVTKMNVELGEKILGTAQFQGTDMMTVSNLDEMNAVVDVDENDVVKIELGDTTNVSIDAFPNRNFMGEVVEIGHSAKGNLEMQEQVINFEVKVRLLEQDPKLRPGMSCDVAIETEKKYGIVAVPHGALISRDDLTSADSLSTETAATGISDNPPTFVFVYDGGAADAKRVEIGISNSKYREITSGLEVGTEVITGPYTAVSQLIQDGMKVEKTDNLGYGR